MGLGKKKNPASEESAEKKQRAVKTNGLIAEAVARQSDGPPSKKKARTVKIGDHADETPSGDAVKGSLPLSEVEGLSSTTKKLLKLRGITSLFEVQHRSFPVAFSGKDTVGRAKTGCGKTLAFCLPIIERIVANSFSDGSARRKPLMLAMAPTRELARQIHTELNAVAAAHGLTSCCLYGGAPFFPQVEELRAGMDAVAATPGRLLDHIKRETIHLDNVKSIVLDEADEMLSMGFQEDVEQILSHIPEKAQKMLFSATMPKWVQNLVVKYLQKDHALIDVVGEGLENQANANIKHQCIPCSPFERGDTLADLCKVHAGKFGKTLVFTDTKKECDEMAQNATLVAMGAGILHGDIPQKAREVTMENFRTGRIKLLIATDVAARGLDVPNVDLVVMTRPPQDLDTYVHRSGRTARAGRTGTCVVFHTRNEEYMIRLLQHKKNIPFERRSPPQPAEVVAQAARDAVRQVDLIHQDNVDAFTKVAEELIEERGSAVWLLAASLAAMTGYTDRIKTRSLLSSYEGSVAMIVESDRSMDSTSKAWYLLRNHVEADVSQACKSMTLIRGRNAAIFDCPQDMVQKVLKAETWDGITFTVAESLPELEDRNGNMSSHADDLKMHHERRQKLWDKIRSKDGGGPKRKFDDGPGNGKGKGSGRGPGRGDGKGKGKGGGRGRGY